MISLNCKKIYSNCKEDCLQLAKSAILEIQYDPNISNIGELILKKIDDLSFEQIQKISKHKVMIV